MPLETLFLRFGVALAIGFLIGLQREHAYSEDSHTLMAGERTFALLSLSGALGALLSDLLDTPLPLIMVILATIVFTAISHAANSFLKDRTGITTEVAVIASVIIGALCYVEKLELAIALGIILTVVLNLKFHTDKLIHALTREDISAALQMAVITAIVLPVLPNTNPWPAPFDVLNPFNIWLMVVFISGISFLGYVLVKFVDVSRGIGLAGLLGGLVSSTAVTLSFSERSKKEEGFSKAFALAILLAWMVMFVRVLIEVGVLNLQLLGIVWPPLAIAGGITLVYVIYLFRNQEDVSMHEMTFNNPFDLWSAIKFGLLYGVVIFISHLAHFYLGESGLYLSSIISGLADVDAITLSMAELSQAGGIDLNVAGNAVILAVMSNTVVKGGLVLMMGAPALRKAILPGLGLILVAGIGSSFLIG